MTSRQPKLLVRAKLHKQNKHARVKKLLKYAFLSGIYCVYFAVKQWRWFCSIWCIKKRVFAIKYHHKTKKSIFWRCRQQKFSGLLVIWHCPLWNPVHFGLLSPTYYLTTALYTVFENSHKIHTRQTNHYIVWDLLFLFRIDLIGLYCYPFVMVHHFYFPTE